MAYFSEQLTFVVSVTNVCTSVVISPPLDSPVIQKDITDTQDFLFTFDEWRMNQVVCGDLTYTVTKKDGKPLPSFINFDASMRTITVQATRPDQVGTHILLFSASIPQKKQSITLEAKITFLCKDAKPEPKSSLDDIIYRLRSGETTV